MCIYGVYMAPGPSTYRDQSRAYVCARYTRERILRRAVHPPSPILSSLSLSSSLPLAIRPCLFFPHDSRFRRVRRRCTRFFVYYRRGIARAERFARSSEVSYRCTRGNAYTRAYMQLEVATCAPASLAEHARSYEVVRARMSGVASSSSLFNSIVRFENYARA